MSVFLRVLSDLGVRPSWGVSRKGREGRKGCPIEEDAKGKTQLELNPAAPDRVPYTGLVIPERTDRGLA